MLFLQLLFVILLHTSLAKIKKEYYDVDNEEAVNALFESFLQKHDKNYNAAEKYRRLNIFRETLKDNNRLNDAHPNTIFGITHFADLTAEEVKRYKGFIPSSDNNLCTVLGDPTTRDAPDAHDWRQHGAVTPIKDQKHCGSCWAFSSTATVESRYAMLTGEQLDLSEQQLVDCDLASKGCCGGAFTTAISKVIEMGGQRREADYHYKGCEGSCQLNSSEFSIKVASCNTFRLSDEDSLKELLFTEGPLYIVIDSSAISFTYYVGGIYNDCNLFNLDHAVQLVGYGSENGEDYWIIKNSWGLNWGEKGFAKMRRGVQCLGLLNHNMGSLTLASQLRA